MICYTEQDINLQSIPATSVATKMGNAFFLKPVITSSLSPCPMSPWSKPAKGRQEDDQEMKK